MDTTNHSTTQAEATDETKDPCNKKDVQNAIREALLRIHFLIYALERSSTRPSSVAAKDRAPLISDLVEESEALEDLLDHPYSPTLATLTSPASVSWQRDLTKSLSLDADRWESTLHIIYEIAEIQNLITLPGNCLTEKKEEFDQLQRKLAAHKLFHENILGQWVNTELSHGRPVDKVIEADSKRHKKQWHDVVEEVLGDRPAANIFANSVQAIWERLAGPFLHPDPPAKKAA